MDSHDIVDYKSRASHISNALLFDFAASRRKGIIQINEYLASIFTEAEIEDILYENISDEQLYKKACYIRENKIWKQKKKLKSGY